MASVARPVEELRAFRRVHLDAGASTRVEMRVPAEMLAFYDPEMRYVLEPGSIDLLVGSSSQDIRLRGSVRIEGERTVVAPRTRYAEVTTGSPVASRL